MSRPLNCLILGGGVAGLWALRSLLAAGADAHLVETRALGHGQTIASQGILHAGTKYALSGSASEASKAVGAAARRWHGALRGEGPVDLSAVEVLSSRTHLFTTPGLVSRLGGLAASKALAIGPRRLERSEFPEGLLDAPGGVDVYSLDEPVLGMHSLIETLAAPVSDRILLADSVSLDWSRDDLGQRSAAALVRIGRHETRVASRVLVLTAGEANERLLESLGLDSELAMQRRPLHMVMARSGTLPHLHGHCVSLSDKPRATITSATDRRGRVVWYIGGQLAESGVDRAPADQLNAARQEIRQILPHIDLTGSEWTTLMIDRAEGSHPDGRRPDTPVVRARENVIACWPTKLVLAPMAADLVLEAARAVTPPAPAPSALPDLRLFPTPPVATPVWDREDIRWT